MTILSLVLTLRPQAAATLSTALGRAAHAALLQAIHVVDPAFAQTLHGGHGLRPFTCSSLLGPRPGGVITPERTYHLRYTGLTADFSVRLETVFAEPGTTLELEGVTFTVEGQTSDEEHHAWAARTDYEPLALRWLLEAQSPDSRVSLHLAAPDGRGVAGDKPL